MNRTSARRILPDFLIAAQVETTSAFVTWNVPDYENLGLNIPVLLRIALNSLVLQILTRFNLFFLRPAH